MYYITREIRKGVKMHIDLSPLGWAFIIFCIAGCVETDMRLAHDMKLKQMEIDND
jgi:hypothetical protein